MFYYTPALYSHWRKFQAPAQFLDPIPKVCDDTRTTKAIPTQTLSIKCAGRKKRKVYILVASNKELFIFHTPKIFCPQFDQERSPMQPFLSRNSIETAMSIEPWSQCFKYRKHKCTKMSKQLIQECSFVLDIFHTAIAYTLYNEAER